MTPVLVDPIIADYETEGAATAQRRSWRAGGGWRAPMVTLSAGSVTVTDA